MILRTRHTSVRVPWPLMILIGPLWLSVMIMYVACLLIFVIGKFLFEVASAIVVACRA